MRKFQIEKLQFAICEDDSNRIDRQLVPLNEQESWHTIRTECEFTLSWSPRFGKSASFSVVSAYADEFSIHQSDTEVEAGLLEIRFSSERLSNKRPSRQCKA